MLKPVRVTWQDATGLSNGWQDQSDYLQDAAPAALCNTVSNPC